MTENVSQAMGKITKINFDYLRDAIGIGNPNPRMSWMVETETPNWLQTAYQVEVYTSDGQLRNQSEKIESSESVFLNWLFEPLQSREQLWLRVKVWGNDDTELPWSEKVAVEAGLLKLSDWSARFIAPEGEEDRPVEGSSPLMRKTFELQKTPVSARLYITSHGLYEAYINGQKVGDHVMAPGWTSYKHRLCYQTLDVTDLLHVGENALGAILADGWFRGRIGFGGGQSKIYGDKVALLAQLEITYDDGSHDTIISDETWRSSTGAITQSSIYDGETYDARLEKAGWNTADYDDITWSAVKETYGDYETLTAPVAPPVRATQLIKPVSIFKSSSGKTLIDFGQNLVGHLRIKIEGATGQVITIRHAEVLENGELCVRALRQAKATDAYILKGDGVEEWEPRFTYHGFRYAEIEGWNEELQPDQIVAVVCHSDMERTGWFDCSNELINRLHENVVWSLRGNFFSIPTDCPQRDERLGWTGDIQVFTPTASFLYDCAGFLTSWLHDLKSEQTKEGMVPLVIPNVLDHTPPIAVWGDSAVFIPWVLYQRYDDTKILADQFQSMCAWVELVNYLAGENHLWDTGIQFGDWLEPKTPAGNPLATSTPTELIATAYFARSAEIVGATAEILGLHEQEKRYKTLASEIRDAFTSEYITTSGRVLGDTATAYTLAIEFNLLSDEEQRQNAGQRLVNIVRSHGYLISTGFVGTSLICDALCRLGQADTAFRLLQSERNPSWLYPVTMGATTIWERWDSMLPDGSVNEDEMTSFNHYASGGVADWMHRVIGGLAPASPGYKKMTMAPQPGGDLNRATAKHLTPYGIAMCSWEIEDNEIIVSVEVPPNTSACVTLPSNPDTSPIEVGSGTYTWKYSFTKPEQPRKLLTVDCQIAELIDDPQALSLIIGAMQMQGVTLQTIETMLKLETLTLRQILSFMPDGDLAIEGMKFFLATLNR